MYRRVITLLTLVFALAGLVVAVPQATGSQSQQSIIRDKLGEIGSWAVPATTSESRQFSQQAYLLDRLAEIGSWAVPTSSTPG